jgi:hypothetical protein
MTQGVQKPQYYLCDYSFNGKGTDFDGVRDLIKREANGQVSVFKATAGKNGAVTYATKPTTTFKETDESAMSRFDVNHDKVADTGAFTPCPMDGGNTLLLMLDPTKFDAFLAKHPQRFDGFRDLNGDCVGDDGVKLVSSGKLVAGVLLHESTRDFKR